MCAWLQVIAVLTKSKTDCEKAKGDAVSEVETLVQQDKQLGPLYAGLIVPMLANAFDSIISELSETISDPDEAVAKFNLMDADGDGKVTKEEFLANGQALFPCTVRVFAVIRAFVQLSSLPSAPLRVCACCAFPFTVAYTLLHSSLTLLHFFAHWFGC